MPPLHGTLDQATIDNMNNVPQPFTTLGAFLAYNGQEKHELADFVPSTFIVYIRIHPVTKSEFGRILAVILPIASTWEWESRVMLTGFAIDQLLCYKSGSPVVGKQSQGCVCARRNL